MGNLLVNTIYPAFMGEVSCHGIGVPCVFVRLAGCNLRCYLKSKGTTCDTPEALEKTSGVPMSTSDIIDRVGRYGRKLICLTGGEPLLQDVTELLTRLSLEGYSVVVETNGSQDVSPYKSIKGVSFVVDCKSTSSGELDKMHEENWALLDSKDYVKFVVDTYDDYVEAKIWMGCHPCFKGNIAIGLFWGAQLSYKELMEHMIKDKLHVYLNMQTHKMSCLYDAATELIPDVVIPRLL